MFLQITFYLSLALIKYIIFKNILIGVIIIKRLKSFVTAILVLSALTVVPKYSASATEIPSITRAQAENRALQMINLTWNYNRSKNSNISTAYTPYVTQANQTNGINSGTMTGIPYNWGGHDSLDSSSYNTPWTNFIDAVNKGAFIGNVNTDAGYGLIPGTAGIDCSGFVQASYNIPGTKLSTYSMFDTYFKKINLSDLKHMDILDRPGDHVLIFDKWGTLNGIQGAFTYESTWDQVFGGIQGTKRYFVTMDDINNGYIPGRYVNIIENTSEASPSTSQTINFIKIANVNYYANFRANASTASNIIGRIPKDTVVKVLQNLNGWYQVSYNGQTGWVSQNLTSSISPRKYIELYNAYMLNIRVNPSTSASIVSTLSNNQYSEVIDSTSNPDWFKISINGIQGWVSNDYVKYIY